MTAHTATTRRSRLTRMALAVALLLSIPLIGTLIGDEVQWGPGDFVVIGGLLIGAGLVYEFMVRGISNVRQRVAIAALLVGAVLLIWAELAVGLFGTPFAGS